MWQFSYQFLSLFTFVYFDLFCFPYVLLVFFLLPVLIVLYRVPVNFVLFYCECSLSLACPATCYSLPAGSLCLAARLVQSRCSPSDKSPPLCLAWPSPPSAWPCHSLCSSPTCCHLRVVSAVIPGSPVSVSPVVGLFHRSLTILWLVRVNKPL